MNKIERIELFSTDNDGNPIVEPAILLMPEIKAIIVRDSSVKKADFYKFLTYVWFRYAHKSPYFGGELEWAESQSRVEAGLSQSWKPDKYELKFIEKFNSFKSPLLLTLETTYVGLNKLNRFINTVDLTETNAKGLPKYSSAMLAKVIGDYPGLVNKIKLLELSIYAETVQSANIRGGGDKGDFEDRED